MRRTAAAAILATLISSGAVSGFQVPTMTVLKSLAVVSLLNGPNQIDLDGDGRADTVFVAWRENFNAHGFSDITFYRSASSTPTWNLVPFVNREGGSAFTSFQTYQGADCVLRDLRILRPRNELSGPVVIVVAERPLGESFAASERVTFTIYRVARNPEEIPGVPPFYFRASETIVSKAAHCDVGEAFASELGIAVP